MSSPSSDSNSSSLPPRPDRPALSDARCGLVSSISVRRILVKASFAMSLSLSISTPIESIGNWDVPAVVDDAAAAIMSFRRLFMAEISFRMLVTSSCFATFSSTRCISAILLVRAATWAANKFAAKSAGSWVVVVCVCVPSCGACPRVLGTCRSIRVSFVFRAFALGPTVSTVSRGAATGNF